MAERQVLRDAINVRLVHDRALAEAAEAFGVFGLRQVAATGAGAQDFAGAGDLEPFGYGFLRFDAFGTSHKFISIAKGRALYKFACTVASTNFIKSCCYGRLLVLTLKSSPVLAGVETSIGAPALSWDRTESVMSLSRLA